MARAKRRGGKLRTTYATKSGSYYGAGRTSKTRRGKPVRKLRNRERKELGTLVAKRRAAAYRPRRRTR